ncbi:MAG: VWA domain-containing protein [Bdellovibrionaceae bacterium]|nr:VWA domain-containing protein [Bdellovibrionales bacterium]MCB9083890.1 VWA domain-containing protein [Pseudobdellovibrionaceae bacterium]
MHLLRKVMYRAALCLSLGGVLAAQAEWGTIEGKTFDLMRFPGKVKIEYLGQAVDILFVVDDSGSMGSHQNNLAQNIDLFLAQIQSLTDYQVGVITTSCDYTGARCGVLRNGFVTPATSDPIKTLRENLLVGTSGSGTETHFKSLAAALSDDIRHGANAGFIREQAHLMIVFVSDAEDQSDDIGVQVVADRLLAVKGSPSMASAHGILVPSNDTTNCIRDDGNTTPARIEDLIGRFNGQVSSLCSATYGEDLVRMAQAVTGLSRRIPLLLQPLVETIRVFFNAVEIPTGILGQGWAYSPETNEVVIGELVDLSGAPDHTPVIVEFVPADEK